jgi:hypothetical protein
VCTIFSWDVLRSVYQGRIRTPMSFSNNKLIPAQAGISVRMKSHYYKIPACAGMTHVVLLPAGSQALVGDYIGGTGFPLAEVSAQGDSPPVQASQPT